MRPRQRRMVSGTYPARRSSPFAAVMRRHPPAPDAAGTGAADATHETFGQLDELPVTLH